MVIKSVDLDQHAYPNKPIIFNLISQYGPIKKSKQRGAHMLWRSEGRLVYLSTQ